ncbi:MAG TPA: hypothetical protein VIY08_05025 [Candidatus Nitrosocosmicus sp.]
MDYKTGRRVNCKEKWNKISLYSRIPHSSKMGIQTEGAKKDTC